MYGKELTFGWLGVLGQEWTSVPYNYEDDQKYDFENAASEVRIDSVWTGLYNAIANANKLLKELEGMSTVIPGSRRIPLVFFILFTVTLNSGIKYPP